MSKLFKLKAWLTLDEAVNHISTVLGESATETDLLRFALDGHLTLSVNFVNHAQVCKGKWVKTDDVQFYQIEKDLFTGEKLEKPISMPLNNELFVSDDNWIALEKPVVSISGVWDLAMVGAETLDIEHLYQQSTSGLEVTLVAIDGAFVKKGDVICQLQTDFDDNEFQTGSRAEKKDLERQIFEEKLSDEEAKELRNKHQKDRAEYLEKRKNTPRENLFYPSGGLGEHDYVLVVRTEEITRFIQSLEDSPAIEKPLASKERNSLLVLIGALCKENGIDPKERGIAAAMVAMTENLGAPLTDDTVRKILNQIENAVSLRNK
ncbi:MAG: hypothetical protein VXB01_09145 [Opitutae bacterium]|jgi:hypothetical protein